MPEITTNSTSRETMDVNPIILHTTGSTRLLFYPKWVEASDNHLRGGFRFEKKGRSETWEEHEGKSITTLHKDEAYELNLNGEDMANLFSNLETIYSALEKHGHQRGRATITLGESNAESILLQLGDIDNRDLVVSKLKELEANKFKSIENAVITAKLQNMIDEITSNMQNNDEAFWQKLFEDNPWVLQHIFHFPFYYMNGETYIGGKSTNGRNGSGGVATDYLMQNGSNNSFAVIEIKTPPEPLVGAEYRGSVEGSQNICHSMSSKLTGAIVQTENQIRVAERDFRTMVGEDYPDLNQTDAIGVLLIGNKSILGSDKQRSFNLFRKSLGKNIVMTYDELLEKLEILKGIYD